MSNPADLKPIIESYCDRHATGVISYTQMLSFIDRYLMENPEKEKPLDDLLRMNGKYLKAHLESLESENYIRILRNNEGISGMVFPKYFFVTIEGAYQKLEDKPELPFPSEDILRLVIPPDDITVLDVKSEFVNWLQKTEIPRSILRLAFPDGISPLVCTSFALSVGLIRASIHKIRHYLRDPKNMAYMRTKLTPIFRGREITVKDMLNTIVNNTDQSIQTIKDPSDFTFQLWTQLCTNLIKEYSAKSDKLVEEHSICQAAYLLGYYNMNYRAIAQKAKEEEASLGILLSNMRRPPYTFRISTMYDFTDDKGIPLQKKIDKDRINRFVQDKLKAKPGKDTPEILSFSTVAKDEFYILYIQVPQLISDSLIRVQKEIRDFYKRSWQIAMRGGIEFTTMHYDEAFRHHVEQYVQRHYPTLDGLLNFSTVYLAANLDGITTQCRLDLNDIIVPGGQRLKPIDQILKLGRKRIVDDAKILLPAWMVVPGIREIVLFFRNLFLGKEMAAQNISMGFDHEGQERYTRKDKSKLDTQKDKKDKPKAMSVEGVQTFRTAARAMEKDFIPPNEDLSTAMFRHLDRWNQLLDAKAKSDLTADVNSLCRDYLKKQRAFNRPTPPESDLIKTYAAKLVQSDLLTGIRNKKDLQKYIELYFLSVLQNA